MAFANKIFTRPIDVAKMARHERARFELQGPSRAIPAKLLGIHTDETNLAHVAVVPVEKPVFRAPDPVQDVLKNSEKP